VKKSETKTILEAVVEKTTEEVPPIQPAGSEQDTEELKSTVAFSVSTLSGCAPLAVTFINESENA